MLVLSRKENETIILVLPTTLEELVALAGASIEVTVTEHRHSTVKIGFEAPRSISIVRKEIA
ncbi:CsrA RNA-binding global regulator CsrA [uncultured Caudovirales phage]|uniref:CsrA RNA-binding global regulator CsrA n=1 Tax=uncultured Caudovirales phage TaxID=2100421 RepID=A0A6J5SBR3_9CAUD|nr:CsrA RNA-binding global regulator CsrA [uncultured Caudovirales phage]CAB4183397.1 CsrA RNA-binding global regulator CsrA [uncultured Caudovirales phage]CAB4198067.1 CsrA RNA-binding global regulator CsrA [uncultured Caudovirales phage]CAB4211308.1 CsrA RNA-binding global regulator CsrA [uncultured Caudovirales phage]CAB5238010.1 CsrA RNA-binding global regulator CsrA [uncultured Caudovirales phage]